MCFVIMLTIKTWIWSRNIYYFYLFIIKNVTLFNNIDGFSFFIFNLLIVILDLKKNYLSYLLALPLTALIIREAFWFHFPEKIRKLHLEFLLFLSIHSVWHFIHLQDWLVSFHWTLFMSLDKWMGIMGCLCILVAPGAAWDTLLFFMKQRIN